MSIQQDNFKAIADKIRENTGTTELIKPLDFASKIDDVYAAGQKASGGGAYDEGFADGRQAGQAEFWDAYQEDGNRTNYAYAFCGRGWTDETYKPKHNITASGAFGYIYSNSLITDTVVPLVFKQHNSTQAFANSKIKYIPSITVASGQTFTNWFAGCSDLVEIRFTDESVIGNNIDLSPCKSLSHESIMNIINALADKTTDTSGTEWVCTLGTDNLNKLSAAEIAVAPGKGWVLA